MPRTLSSIISNLEDVVIELQWMGNTVDNIDKLHPGIIECLQLGLPLLIEKYGHSSTEAEAVDELIARSSTP